MMDECNRLEECSGCNIFLDMVCAECSRYQECIDRGMNFSTLENQPEEGYPNCFSCKFFSEKECKAG